MSTDRLDQLPNVIAYPDNFEFSNLFPYVNLKNPDSWLTSHVCWTSYCLADASLIAVYDGQLLYSHISNGTISRISSALDTTILGLQITNNLCPGQGLGSRCIYNVSFIEGYEITSQALPGSGGMLGLGTIYGSQTNLIPLVYQAFMGEQIDETIFSLWWHPESELSSLWIGHPPEPNTWSNGSVAPNIPLAVKDGTWNFLMNNFFLDSIATGANGLAVLDTLSTYITLPKAVGAVFAALAGAETTEIDGYDYYNISCPTDNLPNMTFVSSEGEIPLFPADYSFTDGSNCFVNIRGGDLKNADGIPYWNLGLPLIESYYTIYNFTLGAETITFNVTGSGEV